MDSVTEALMRDFAESNELTGLTRDKQFEHFASYSVVSSRYTEEFDTDDLVVGDGQDLNVDAFAVKVNGRLASDADYIDDVLALNGYLDTEFIIIQAKSSSSFDGAAIIALGDNLVNEVFAPKQKLPVNDEVRRLIEELALLRSAKTNSVGALNRLYELIEQDLAAPSDRDFAERLTHHRQRIAALTSDIISLERQLTSSQRRITPDLVGRFGDLLRDGLRGENPALRQAYVRLLVDEVIVGEKNIRVRGSRKALESAVIATSASTGAGVPSFAREWRTQEDSNLWPLPSEGSALSS